MLLGLIVVLGTLIVPPWVASWWAGLLGATRRAIAIGFLRGTLIAYAAVLASSLIGGAAAMVRVIAGRRDGLPRPISARVLLLSVSCLFALMVVEVGAWRYNVWSRRLPDMPGVPPASSGPKTNLTILVLGESSAEGQPYQGWMSIADIVAWQMERALPGTRVQVIMGATGGVPLAYSFPVMDQQTERPDMVLVYAGHNEFQALWGWSRIVNYYTDELARPRARDLVDRVNGWTPLATMIHDAVDHQRLDRPPTLDENRMLGERPICEPETRVGLRNLFENELEVVVRWCEKAGALPILVIPAGNDVGFDPSRSVMAANTSRADRERFLRDFEAAKTQAEADPQSAVDLFRKFVARQPIHAESHYRLAQALQTRGQTEEARTEYRLARDLDGMPMRCPSEFQEAYRHVASRHEVMLVDASQVLQALSPTGLLDDHVFHDGQHTTFRGYVALAQDVVDRLWASGALNLPEGPAPRLDPEECARHFGITPARLAEVCRRTAGFWHRMSAVKLDAGARLARRELYSNAAKAIDDGRAPDSLGVPGLGIHPPGLP